MQSLQLNISEFLKLEILKLPSESKRNIDFSKHIEDGLNKYQDQLKNVKEITGVDREVSRMGEAYINTICTSVRKLSIAIIGTLQKYFDEKPADAYSCLKLALDESIFASGLHFCQLKSSENYYRLRPSECCTHIFEPKDLFHIPLNERSKVSTQRFSIATHPCLYIADSAYLAWKELKEKDTRDLQISRFQVKNNLDHLESITLLDLTNILPKLLKEANSEKPCWDGELYRYLILWPLIFATSVKVKNSSEAVKPEYIIPQLLMKYITEPLPAFKIHGIKYSSTHYDLYSDLPEASNYAIPVNLNSNGKYCDLLTMKLNFTRPQYCSVNKKLNKLNEFKTLEDELIKKELIQIDINGKIIQQQMNDDLFNSTK